MNNNSRRRFLKKTMMAAGVAMVMPSADILAADKKAKDLKHIMITEVNSDFEREALIRPFGFKGGYMTEIWQTVAQLKSSSGVSSIGVCSQNVLYSDAKVFAGHSEAAGNALMY